MSKSAIYTANTAGQAIAVNGIIPVGTTSRRYGCNLRQDGNTITMTGKGYYLINASATVTPSAAGTATITAQKDGVAIIGATASETVAAADTAVNMAITAIVRNVCDCDSSILSFILTGAASVVDNLAISVEKL